MKLKIKHKISLAFGIVAIIAMTIIATVGYYTSKNSLEEQSYAKLTAIRNSKAQELKRYFKILENLATCIGQNKVTIEAFENFNSAFNKLKQAKISPDSLNKLAQLRDDYYYTRHALRTKEHSLSKEKHSELSSNNKESVILQSAVNGLIKWNEFNLSEYKNALDKFEPIFQNFQIHTEFKGLLLINSQTGDVIYTVNKLIDIGANVFSDSLKNSNLAELVNKINADTNQIVQMADYSNYFPADNLPKAFMGYPIVKNGKKIGILALRIPIDNVDKVMTFEKNWLANGLGNTGEVYLFGDKLMLRSQSRFFIENPTAFKEFLRKNKYPEKEIQQIEQSGNLFKTIKVKTDATLNAIKGDTNTNIIEDYRGEKVLSAYMPINIIGLHWGIAAEIDAAEAFEPVALLKKIMMVCFFILLLTVIIVAYLIAHYISKPINSLTASAEAISNGNYESLINIKQTDEIGMLAQSFTNMREKVVSLIHNLRISNNNLEEKQKEIIDSIKYARKIQDNILASESLLLANLKEYFVYFNPKDVVSGDFYWATLNDDGFYMAVCDSTGHGVPGAFMSLLNVSYLNEAINIKNIVSPELILEDVRNSLIETMSNEENKDGMDGVLIRLRKGSNMIQYAGAFNKPILIRNNTIISCDVDKMPIGKGIKTNPFTLHEINIEPGDVLYLLSDGFPDQFGGPLNKKYKIKHLTEFLLSINHQPIKTQKELLKQEFENWRGENDQVDDVLIVGIKF